MRSWLFALVLLCASTFVLHLVWERAHLPLYRGYEALATGTLPIYVWASVGDVLYTLLAILLVSLCAGGLSWLGRPGAARYAALTMLGFLISLGVEYKALALGRWAYAETMPIIPHLGVGLSPVLQMTVLLPVSVFIVAVALRALGRTL